jgi:hypothetical protein
VDQKDVDPGKVKIIAQETFVANISTTDRMG